jgi:hypothetical protein
MITHHKSFQFKGYSRQKRLVFVLFCFLMILPTFSAECAAEQKSVHPRPGGLFDIEIPGPNTAGFDMSSLVQGAVTIFGEGGDIKFNCERAADGVFMELPEGERVKR